MASIYDLKPKFQNLLRPSVRWLADRQVTPNQVTVSALFLSFLGGLILALFPSSKTALLLIPAILLIRMMLNAIDGMLAREYHMQSSLGTFLNELGDVISDSFLYLPFCLVPGLSCVLVVLVVIFAIITEMAGVVAIQVGSSRRYDGPMGKSDRAFVFGLMGLLLGLSLNLTFWCNLILFISLLLLLITLYNRVVRALREVNHAS